MEWTKERPTRAGYYWVRKFKLDQEVELRVETEMVYRGHSYFGEEPSFSFTGNDTPFSVTEGEFYGPLEPPN